MVRKIGREKWEREWGNRTETNSDGTKMKIRETQKLQRKKNRIGTYYQCTHCLKLYHFLSVSNQPVPIPLFPGCLAAEI